MVIINFSSNSILYNACDLVIFITARKRSCRKVMFSQASVCSRGGIPCPMSFLVGGYVRYQLPSGGVGTSRGLVCLGGGTRLDMRTWDIQLSIRSAKQAVRSLLEYFLVFNYICCNATFHSPFKCKLYV